jgi:hypothetical protein
MCRRGCRSISEVGQLGMMKIYESGDVDSGR